jgi:hypothetical protein
MSAGRLTTALRTELACRAGRAIQDRLRRLVFIDGQVRPPAVLAFDLLATALDADVPLAFQLVGIRPSQSRSL